MSEDTTPEIVAETSEEAAARAAATSDAIGQAVIDKPKYTGIAVLGSHPDTVQQAPFDDPEWLVYACSPHNLDIDAMDGRDPNARHLAGGTRFGGKGNYRVDEWFEVHMPLEDESRPYSYCKALESLPLVWMMDPKAARWIKGARQFPFKELAERFGGFFWTSSIAFILAKAILDCEKLGIRRIGIWGVMQASENEYMYQRPGIQYWVQRATDLGIEVMAPRESQLFEPQRVRF